MSDWFRGISSVLTPLLYGVSNFVGRLTNGKAQRTTQAVLQRDRLSFEKEKLSAQLKESERKQNLDLVAQYVFLEKKLDFERELFNAKSTLEIQLTQMRISAQEKDRIMQHMMLLDKLEKEQDFRTRQTILQSHLDLQRRKQEIALQAHFNSKDRFSSVVAQPGQWKEMVCPFEKEPIVIYNTLIRNSKINTLVNPMVNLAQAFKNDTNHLRAFFSVVDGHEGFLSESHVRSFYNMEFANSSVIIVYGDFLGNSLNVYALCGGILGEQLAIDENYNVQTIPKAPKHFLLGQFPKSIIDSIVSEETTTNAQEAREYAELVFDFTVNTSLQVLIDQHFAFFPEQKYEPQSLKIATKKAEKLNKKGVDINETLDAIKFNNEKIVEIGEEIGVKQEVKRLIDEAVEFKIRYQYELALNVLNKALELDDKSYRIYDELGQVYSSLDNYAKALEFKEKALELKPNSCKAYIGMASVYFDKNELEKATVYLDKAANLEPDSVEVLGFKASLALVYENDYEKALDFYKKALKKNVSMESRINLNCNIAHIYEQQKKPKESLKYLERAVLINKNSVYAYLSKGSSFLLLKDEIKAKSNFKYAIDLSNNYWKVNYLAGLYSYQSKIYDLALGYLDKAQNLKPNNVMVLSLKANALQHLDKREKAIKLYKKVLKLDKKNYASLFSLAYLYFEQEEYEKAIKQFKKAIKYSPKEADYIPYSQYYIAQSLRKLNNSSDALNYYAEAINSGMLTNGDLENALLQRAPLLRESKRYDEALSDYTKLLEITKSEDMKHIYLYHMAFCESKVNFYEKSLSNITKAINSPEVSDKHKMIFYNHRAEMHNKLGNYYAAIDDCDKSLSIDANEESNVLAYFYKGEAYFSLNNYETAKSYYEKCAIHKSPCGFIACSKLIMSFRKLGNYKGVIIMSDIILDKVLNLGEEFQKLSEKAFKNLNKEEKKSKFLPCVNLRMFFVYNARIEEDEYRDCLTSIYLSRAIAYKREYNYSKALSDCEKAILIDPQNQEAINLKQQLS